MTVCPVKPPSTLHELPRTAQYIPAVEVPAPGASYNPSPEAHQDILQEAYAIEVKKQQAKEALDKRAPKKETLLRVQNLDAHLTMDIDLPSEDEEEGVEGTHNEDEEVVVKNPVKEKRKTQADRNREKRIQQEQKELEQKRQEKKLLAELEL